MKKYRYFISYFYMNDKGSGLGRGECIRSSRINNIDKVENMEKKLQEETGFKKVIILNWRLFNDRV